MIRSRLSFDPASIADQTTSAADSLAMSDAKKAKEAPNKLFS